MVKLADNEEIISSDFETLEEALEQARLTLEDGAEIFLISEDKDGNEILIPINVEKKDEN